MFRNLPRLLLLLISVAVVVFVMGLGCIGSSGGESGDGASSATRRQFPLESLPTSTVNINEHTFRVWLVTTPEQREEGLMFVPENEIADDQGMLFVFPDERYQGFWMKNTITPLDVAFARMNGTIVAVHTMPPLTLRTFPSLEPAMFALEVKAGTFDRLGVREGDRLDIPDDVFKTTP
ncbi:MAG: DUF192 domain-containing protein [Phycisphaerae bacterium]